MAWLEIDINSFFFRISLSDQARHIVLDINLFFQHIVMPYAW